MHTAFSLKDSMFGAEINGQAADPKGLLDWAAGDRLGIVLNSPLGGLGASLLIQLATMAYYDVRPGRRESPHYAEIYLFHSGGRYGDFSSFDVLPRREVFLPAEPEALIEAINDRAITHLAVPDRMPGNPTFPWTEVESARDRIRHCFVYTAQGRLDDGDTAIISRDPGLNQDVELALEPKALLENIEQYMDAGDAAVQRFSKGLAQRLRGRLTEISADEQATAKAYHKAISDGGLTRQTFRRVSVDEALALL